jgi:hypothetical protein
MSPIATNVPWNLAGILGLLALFALVALVAGLVALWLIVVLRTVRREAQEDEDRAAEGLPPKHAPIYDPRNLARRPKKE